MPRTSRRTVPLIRSIAMAAAGTIVTLSSAQFIGLTNSTFLGVSVVALLVVLYLVWFRTPRIAPQHSSTPESSRLPDRIPRTRRIWSWPLVACMCGLAASIGVVAAAIPPSARGRAMALAIISDALIVICIVFLLTVGERRRIVAMALAVQSLLVASLLFVSSPASDGGRSAGGFGIAAGPSLPGHSQTGCRECGIARSPIADHTTTGSTRPTVAPSPQQAYGQWSFPLRVAAVGTSRGPALAELNGVLYMAWKGSGSDTQIYWAAFDGATWSSQQVVPNTSINYTPALAAFGGSLYLAWSHPADDGIAYARFDGNQWSGPQLIGDAGTSSGPALTACNDTLYLAWKGSGTDPMVWWKASSDGTSWSGQQSVPGASTSNQPTLACLNGSVYLAWSDTADDGITFTRYDGGGNQWETPQSVGNAGTSTGPTMTGFNGRLYMAWKGTGTDTNVYWASSDGARWTPQQNVPNVSTGHGPALAGLRSHLYLTSSDLPPDDGISWTRQ